MDLSTELAENFEAHYPRGFFVRLLEEFEQDYSGALDSAMRRFNRPEAMDLLPYERRARNENSLLHVAKEFRHRGIVAESILNVTGSNFHVEVRSGPYILTQSFVPNSGGLVRLADFRGTLAHDRQQSFIPQERPAGDRYYGILIHGNRRIAKVRYHGVLGFYELGVPNQACDDYLDTPINLVDRYANDDIDPEDVRAALENGINIPAQRRPSALQREYRRLKGYGA